MEAQANILGDTYYNNRRKWTPIPPAFSKKIARSSATRDSMNKQATLLLETPRIAIGFPGPLRRRSLTHSSKFSGTGAPRSGLFGGGRKVEMEMISALESFAGI